jgi:predicted  nucleic acid-binding Zn-ribbon protein
MRKRHEECIRRLREEPARADATPREREEQTKLQTELDSLNKRLLTKEKATETLDDLREQHRKKMETMREEMAQTMAEQFTSIQDTLVQDIQGLQQAIETKAQEKGEMVEKRLREKHEAALSNIQSEISCVVEGKKKWENDVSQLRVQLAAAEQRVETFQELQQDAVRDREELQKEKREQADQASDQLKRLSDLEGEMQRYRSEATVLQAETERLAAARSQDVEMF